MGSTKMPNFVNRLIHFFGGGIGLRGAKETEKANELQQSSSSVCLRLDGVGHQQLAQESSEGQREQPGRKKNPQIHVKDKVQRPIKPDYRIVYHRPQYFTNEYTLNVKVSFSIGGLTRTVILLAFIPMIQYTMSKLYSTRSSIIRGQDYDSTSGAKNFRMIALLVTMLSIAAAQSSWLFLCKYLSKIFGVANPLAGPSLSPFSPPIPSAASNP